MVPKKFASLLDHSAANTYSLLNVNRYSLMGGDGVESI